jgi:hypothetical protein
VRYGHESLARRIAVQTRWKAGRRITKWLTANGDLADFALDGVVVKMIPTTQGMLVQWRREGGNRDEILPLICFSDYRTAKIAPNGLMASAREAA